MLQREEGDKQKEEISEDTPWGRKMVKKMYPTKLCVKLRRLKEDDVYVIEHFKDSVSGAEKESEAIISDS